MAEIASSEHLYCSMVVLFLTRLSNPPTDIFEVKITENSDLKNYHKSNQPTHTVFARV
jgi:hypothetical protein